MVAVRVRFSLRPSRIGFFGCIFVLWRHRKDQTGSLKRFSGVEPMTNKQSTDPDEGVRRFLRDFRSHVERRSFEERRAGERRSGEHEVKEDRRKPGDRRDRYDRRETLLDRRRGTPECFIREHMELIRDVLHDASAGVVCPRCGGELLLGPSLQRGKIWVREVHCTACRHHVVIPDVSTVLQDGGNGPVE